VEASSAVPACSTPDSTRQGTSTHGSSSETSSAADCSPGDGQGCPVHDDVRTVGAHNLERVECIAGGFPCKGASTAGKRTGLAHPETALWAEFARIVGELEPRWVVVENVANILALHDGAVWGTVLGDLAALGFDVAWDCVPAAAFGAPHGRDRVVALAAHPARVAERAADGPADAVDWREFEPAIRRWEAIHGPAPEPLVRRLDARRADLSDVQKGLDRSAMRAQRARLSALGDGVQVQLARLVGEALNELENAA
jgi:site-specific DNA-cytosine methylase